MKADTQARGRIAPSPSGYMHLGNAFSALLAWAFARSAGGSFVLRLEDLDERCQNPVYAKGLLDDLSWLGIDWDGEPVVQVNRVPAYEEALERIVSRAEIYPCFCSRADLHAASAPHASDGTPLYAGTCYSMDAHERETRAAGQRHALRLHVPDETIDFVDAIQGPYEQNLARECGDFVLRRSDGVFAYQLVCVVDDIASGVTQVVRGSDLLSSTPRQILLYELLDAPIPEFAHHPLLLAADGRRLSKRDGDSTIASMRERGIAPETVIGYLAQLAGQVEEAEPMSARELVGIFDASKIPTRDMTVDLSCLEA
ncbi:MAG: tRNA glutamyl-Q(34) synthetase GluQRS [Coriobacteriales bacterium]